MANVGTARLGAIRSAIAEAGTILFLTGRIIITAVKPPITYGGELLDQFLFVLRVAWLPMVITSLAISYGPVGIETASFLNLFGALDRLGGLFVIAVVREFAPLVCAIVVAGAAGTAITADLGSRKIRDELDALMVLGIDPIKSLVVPRFIALVVITSLLDIFAVAFGIFGGVLVMISNHQPLGPFWATFFSSATTIELGASLVKTAIYGGIIGVVCCYKGLTVKGGPEGVGRAVNEAVVIAFLALGAVDYVMTQALLATHPFLNAQR